MKENELRKIINNICDGYTDTIVDEILNENISGFIITKAVCNFISELKEQNIIIELNDIFNDLIIDMLFREVRNYLAR